MAQTGVGSGKKDPFAGIAGIAKAIPTVVAPKHSIGAAPVANVAPAPAAEVYSGGGGGGGYSDGGGYGGGGGGGAEVAAVAAAPARPDLNSYIQTHFLKQQQDAENARKLAEFDLETKRGEKETRADMALKGANLQTDLNEAGVANAEGMAGRGLLRSGLTFQGQDKINQQGVQKRSAIDQLLSEFTNNRTSQRLQTEAAARAASVERQNQIMQQYQTQYGLV